MDPNEATVEERVHGYKYPRASRARKLMQTNRTGNHPSTAQGAELSWRDSNGNQSETNHREGGEAPRKRSAAISGIFHHRCNNCASFAQSIVCTICIQWLSWTTKTRNQVAARTPRRRSAEGPVSAVMTPAFAHVIQELLMSSIRRSSMTANATCRLCNLAFFARGCEALRQVPHKRVLVLKSADSLPVMLCTMILLTTNTPMERAGKKVPEIREPEGWVDAKEGEVVTGLSGAEEEAKLNFRPFGDSKSSWEGLHDRLTRAEGEIWAVDMAEKEEDASLSIVTRGGDQSSDQADQQTTNYRDGAET
ncbi:hypothetical protein B0H14DRAFT_3570509 [Mycena olivaceomarginata]|nr:hypothetical protein B0H14DRAFT_3570509 [Mycena olivaceomarginata]